MREERKVIPGYPRYEITSCGEVRVIATGKIKQCPLTKDGYRCTGLSRDGKEKTFMVHRLVWMAHVGPIPAGLQINHIDGCKTNNHLSNLEVVTNRENCAHAHSLGLIARVRIGEAHEKARLTEASVREIRDSKESNASLGEKYGCSAEAIRKVRNGRSWKHVA